MKYFFASLILSTAVMTSCGEAETKTADSKTEVTSDEESQDEEVLVESDGIEEIEQSYADESVQSQWDDIIAQIKVGEKANLEMYIDGAGDIFSEEVWNAVDFSQAEYYAAFSAYPTFDDIPNAEGKGEGTKVVTVNFVTSNDGKTFESTAMIYLVLTDGLVWINGCELAG